MPRRQIYTCISERFIVAKAGSMTRSINTEGLWRSNGPARSRSQRQWLGWATRATVVSAMTRFYENALKIKQNALDDNDVGTAAITMCIGLAFFRREDWSLAWKKMDRARDIWQRTLGSFHPQTLYARDVADEVRSWNKGKKRRKFAKTCRQLWRSLRLGYTLIEELILL